LEGAGARFGRAINSSSRDFARYAIVNQPQNQLMDPQSATLPIDQINQH
jgi:hypothetical protein